MALSRQEYPALLQSLQPNQAVAVLDERVRTIGRITGDIAEWLAERRRVEEAYASGLRRLAAKRPENPTSLGVFKEPWKSLLGSCETYADSHETLARKIELDVEKPLREYYGKGKELATVTTMQGNLASVAKDVDEAQKRSNKVLAKGNKADNSKLSGALSGVDDAQREWENTSPFIFEQLQALDESRVNHLRDALTQLQTHEVDQLQRSRAVAENTLNTVLTIDTAEEISRFVAATTQGAPALSSVRRQSRHSTNLSTSSAGPPPATAASTDSVPPVPDIPSMLAPPASSRASRSASGDDGRSDRSVSTTRASESRSQAPPAPVTEKKKSGFGGLRRLGTVMSRRKTDPKPPPPVAPSPEKKAKPRRNPLRRGSSSRNSMYQLNSPSASMTELADTSATRTPTAGGANDRPQSAQASRVETNGSAHNGGSLGGTHLSNGSSTVPDAPQERKPRPPSTIQEEGEYHPSTTGTSSAIDAITQAERDAADTEQPQFKLDIKNEPIQEEGGDSAQALSNVANTLRMGAQPTTRRANTVRGRRDVRNTIFVPSGTAPESVIPSSSTDSSLAPVAASPLARSPDDARPGIASDAQSIRSAHSLSSLSHGAVKHAEMHAPGLNASIVETVSAWFSGGVVTKAIAIGEVALLHNGPDPSASPSPGTTTNKTAATSTTIRLENFPVLEKVAPNPTFVTPLPGKSGEYTADVAAMARPQVAFKYQVHLDEGSLGAHAPLQLAPTWKVEATQASVMLSYGFNTAFVGAQRSVDLSNVVVMVGVEGARATACLSKPAGTFSREKGIIYWRLGDLRLSQWAADDEPLRLLARFTTEGEAKPGPVEARWEVVGGSAEGVGSGLGISFGERAEDEQPKEEGGNDPFADESLNGSWKAAEVQRRIVSGKYVAI